MADELRALIAGNWKMNGLTASMAELDELVGDLSAQANSDVLICPPATLVASFASRAKGSAVSVGGQDCHTEVSGAHTGDISAEMLKDAGASYVIVGHSERRADHGETDQVVADKANAVQRAGLIPIVCVGETLSQRETGTAVSVVTNQIEGSLPSEIDPQKLVIAYEPVWAIGTGKVAGVAEISEIHNAVRAALEGRFGGAGGGIQILYGGSVKPNNAEEILGVENVNGALVGGASLKAADFIQIIRAC